MRPLLVATLVLLPLGVNAQEHHALHHAYYQNWVNQEDKGCCNDQDCGELKEEDERHCRERRFDQVKDDIGGSDRQESGVRSQGSGVRDSLHRRSGGKG